MSEVAILVPVLARPQNVAPLLRSIEATTPAHRTLFIASPGDGAEIAALDAAGADYITVEGGYARKINRGVVNTTEPLIFLGADDLRFRGGWLQEAVAKLNPAQVVGVNDLIPRSRAHATHFLVTREYAERRGCIDAPGLLSEAYDHSYVDDELIATAKHHGVYTYATDSHVRHLHPDAGTAEWDDTYRRGRAQMRIDGKRFRRRKRLWT